MAQPNKKTSDYAQTRYDGTRLAPARKKAAGDAISRPWEKSDRLPPTPAQATPVSDEEQIPLSYPAFMFAVTDYDRNRPSLNIKLNRVGGKHLSPFMRVRMQIVFDSEGYEELGFVADYDGLKFGFRRSEGHTRVANSSASALEWWADHPDLTAEIDYDKWIKFDPIRWMVESEISGETKSHPALILDRGWLQA